MTVQLERQPGDWSLSGPWGTDTCQDHGGRTPVRTMGDGHLSGPWGTDTCCHVSSSVILALLGERHSKVAMNGYILKIENIWFDVYGGLQ